MGEDFSAERTSLPTDSRSGKTLPAASPNFSTPVPMTSANGTPAVPAALRAFDSPPESVPNARSFFATALSFTICLRRSCSCLSPQTLTLIRSQRLAVETSAGHMRVAAETSSSNKYWSRSSRPPTSHGENSMISGALAASFRVAMVRLISVDFPDPHRPSTPKTRPS